MKKQTIVKKEINSEFVKKWIGLGINPILVSILNRRGVNEDLRLLEFLYSTFEYHTDPFKYKDMVKTCERIDRAITNREKIIIFGDKDVDGTTSVSILRYILNKYDVDFAWDLPFGDDSYGINSDRIDQWIKDDIKLCISVDCGITNTNEINTLKKSGIDTIIIDHHEPPVQVPEAYSIINPKCDLSIDSTEVAACNLAYLTMLAYLLYKSQLFNKRLLYISRLSNYFVVSETVNLTDIKVSVANNLNSIDTSVFDLVLCENGIDTSIIKNNNLRIVPEFADYNSLSLEIRQMLMPVSAKSSIRRAVFGTLPDFNSFHSFSIQLVTLGTIADIISLTDGNRSLVKEGLRIINNDPSLPIKQLLDSVKNDAIGFTAKDCSWLICPILNAPGRMGDARVTVKFLSDPTGNKEDFDRIIAYNEDRKLKGKEAIDTFTLEINDNIKKYNNKLVFLYDEQVNKGITGIAASKISNEYNIPAIVAAKQGSFYTGSIRGKTSLSFVELLDMADHLLVQYGGHKSAAGFTIHEDNLQSFIKFLQEKSINFNNDQSHLTLDIDAEIPLKYLNEKLFSIIEHLEPIGEKNGPPLFLTQGIKPVTPSAIGKDKNHIKFYIDHHTGRIPCLFWGEAEYFFELYKPELSYNIVYNLGINHYNGNYIPQLIILHIEVNKDE